MATDDVPDITDTTISGAPTNMKAMCLIVMIQLA